MKLFLGSLVAIAVVLAGLYAYSTTLEPDVKVIEVEARSAGAEE